MTFGEELYLLSTLYEYEGAEFLYMLAMDVYNKNKAKMRELAKIGGKELFVRVTVPETSLPAAEYMIAKPFTFDGIKVEIMYFWKEEALVGFHFSW
jgi:hypothetical protein